MEQPFRIALTGTPNSGKTTLFNALTGARETVGNRPGVTVELREAPLTAALAKRLQPRLRSSVSVTDLPGIYSLSPASAEERLTRSALLHGSFDAVIQVIDGTRPERELALTLQLCETDLPLVLAINRMDLLEASAKDPRMQGTVVDPAALQKELSIPVVGIAALQGRGIVELAEAACRPARSHGGYRLSEAGEAALADLVAADPAFPARHRRFYALRRLEEDAAESAEHPLSPAIRARTASVLQRTRLCLGKSPAVVTASARHDAAAVLCRKAFPLRGASRSRTAALDRVLLSRWAGLPCLFLILAAVYFFTVSLCGRLLSAWLGEAVTAGIVVPKVRSVLLHMGGREWLVSLCTEGILGGVGTVLSFAPQIFLLFLALALLEECGYLARIAYLLDRLFRKFGLSGSSVIAWLLGSGCAVSGILASRSVSPDGARLRTAVTVSYIPCTAKLPMIALLAGIRFGGGGWVLPLCYGTGLLFAFLRAGALRRNGHFGSGDSAFLLELPDYRLPKFSRALRNAWDRLWEFLRKAGCVLLPASCAVWALLRIGFLPEGIGFCRGQEQSLLAAAARGLAPLFVPLGFGCWQAVTASLTGWIAKENIVSTCAILAAGAGLTLRDAAAIWIPDPAAGAAFLLFHLLHSPCIAALAAEREEIGSPTKFWRLLLRQNLLAYFAALTAYQIGGWAFGVHPFTRVTAYTCTAAAVWLALAIHGRRGDAFPRKSGSLFGRSRSAKRFGGTAIF